MADSEWLKQMFGADKPIIASWHLNPLPGDPDFDADSGMDAVIEWARKDLKALQDGGVDGVMLTNEFSIPYMTEVPQITVASMARVLGELRNEISVPFGVNVLWDPNASLDLAAATGASFVREVFTGVYGSDFGLWQRDAGRIVRHAHTIGAHNVRLLFNVVPEFATYLGDRDITEIVRSTEFSSHPDALLVSGLTAGAAADTQILRAAKKAAKRTPVIVNTGVKLENAKEQLGIADGAIVGTAFKYDGVFENHVDENRVREFMKAARNAANQ